MVVDSIPKLTRRDWIREQTDDIDIGKIVQLLKDNRLNKYETQKMDSGGEYS